MGVATRLMMSHPAFARQPFGEWARVLDGQARRGHQVFVLDASHNAVGFFGYALTTEEAGMAWAAGKRSPSYEECLDGDCLIFNAWIAPNSEVLRFMWAAFRRLARGKKAVFYKRFYDDGSVRPGRLTITDAIVGHIARSERVQQALVSVRSAESSELI
ncbi:toxin-activating lysine-acyltransferase [Methylorubrum populi]